MTDPRDSNPGTVALPDTRIRGRFLWHELMTTDTRTAADFYTRLAGWTLQAWDQNPSYQMFLAGGVPMAGLMTLPDEAKLAGAPPGWLGYIGSPDADATAHLAVKLGGRLLKEAMQVPGVGRFIVLQDPYGAAFSAFTPEQEPVGDEQPGLGDFSWHELATRNVEGAVAYYAELFGWTKTDAMDMGPGMGVYQMFGMGGQTLGGIYKLPPNAKYPSSWLPYALVTSSDRVAALVPRLGGTVINGPMDVPGGDQIVQLLDPQGGMFAVHSKGTARGSAADGAAPQAVAGGTAQRRKNAAAARAGKAATAGRRATPGRRKAAAKRTVKRGVAKLKGKVRKRAAAARVRGRALKAKVRRTKRTIKRTVKRAVRRRGR